MPDIPIQQLQEYTRKLKNDLEVSLAGEVFIERRFEAATDFGRIAVEELPLLTRRERLMSI